MKFQLLVLLISIAACNVEFHHLRSSQSHEVISNTPTHHSSVNGGSIFSGFILGPIVFICSFICIWYNEKRAAIDARRLKLGRQICEFVDVTSQQSAMSKDGKLVYANGETRTSAVIGDKLSGVNGPGLIKIRRIVQVLEWRAHQVKQNNQTHYEYKLEWVTENQVNAQGKTNSPANWFIKSETFYNEQVYLGGYNISKEVADKCSKSLHYNLTLQNAQSILSNTGRNAQPTVADGYIYFPPSGGYQGAPGYVNQQAEGLMRVSYSLTPTGPMSLVGKSDKSTFHPFDIAAYQGTKDQTNSVPDCCCCLVSSCYAELLKPIQQLLEVYEQSVTKDVIFDRSVQKSECYTTVIRVLAFVTMVLGIYLFFSPIVILLGYIPLVGGIISGIVGFAIFLAALLISIPLYLIAISISWLFWHPKVGIILILIAGAITALVLILGHK